MGDSWSQMAPVWLDGPPLGLWRAHSDAVNRALADRWLTGPLGVVLKTDLFDEAVSGGVLPALAPRATHLIGIDVDAAICERAATRLPDVEVVEADVRRLPFADAAMDTVLSNSTLDHFADAEEIHVALSELVRVLRPGGRLLVTLDNPRNPIIALSKALPRSALNTTWSRLGPATARVGLAPYVVGATLSPSGLRQALLSAGFRPVASDTIVHAPRVLAVLAGSRLDRGASAASRRRFLRALEACERLRGTPVAPITAHFHAALAIREGS